MDRDFFIALAFATHRVAERLSDPAPLKKASNTLLADFLLFCEDNPVVPLEEKKNILPRTLRELDAMQTLLAKEKGSKKLNPLNFVVLEKEYAKIPSLLVSYLEEQKRTQRGDGQQGGLMVAGFGGESPAGFVKQSISGVDERFTSGVDEQTLNVAGHEVAQKPQPTPRQQKIMEALETEGKAQIKDLQKIFPEVTKRTLRRDTDALVRMNIVERKGEWNTVFYQLKR